MSFHFHWTGHGFAEHILPIIFGAVGTAAAVLLLIVLVLYVFHSLSIYTLAKRRQLRHAWLSWIPVANAWIMGSLSDQYQYMTRQKICTRRKTLLGLHIAMAAMAIPIAIAGGMLAFRVMSIVPWEGWRQFLCGEVKTLSVPVVPMKSLIVPVCILAVEGILQGGICLAVYIQRQIVYYHIYSSCEPDTAVLFLILGIFFAPTTPFFLFADRKKDNGVSARAESCG